MLKQRRLLNQTSRECAPCDIRLFSVVSTVLYGTITVGPVQRSACSMCHLTSLHCYHERLQAFLALAVLLQRLRTMNELSRAKASTVHHAQERAHNNNAVPDRERAASS
jgi:hypothetical protein